LKKFAAEKMLRRMRFGAQHITRMRVRKIFFERRVPQMPCFLGLRAQGASGEASWCARGARRALYESSPSARRGPMNRHGETRLSDWYGKQRAAARIASEIRAR
jgi:hypothetical protein